MKQHSEPVAVIYPPTAGELSVHIARWESDLPGDEERPALVMYRDASSRYHYLAPVAARLFAKALLEAADKIEVAQEPVTRS